MPARCSALPKSARTRRASPRCGHGRRSAPARSQRSAASPIKPTQQRRDTMSGETKSINDMTDEEIGALDDEQLAAAIAASGEADGDGADGGDGGDGDGGDADGGDGGDADGGDGGDADGGDADGGDADGGDADGGDGGDGDGLSKE